MNIEKVANTVIGCAIMVHRELGPGLMESVYEAGLAYEVGRRGIFFERQKELPVIYRGVPLDCLFRMDMVVEKQIVIEIKSVAQLEPIHLAQLLSYLRLSKSPIGLLMNFNSATLKDGLKRLVNNYSPSRA